MAQILIDERRKREIDPTRSMLRGTLLEKANLDIEDRYALQRMQQMHDLIELLVSWHTEMQTMTSQRLRKMLKLGSGVNKVLDLADKMAITDKESPRQKANLD